MADITKTVALPRMNRSTSVTVSGTKPFAARQGGGPAGAYHIVDATGANANLRLDGSNASSVFSAHGIDDVNAILAAVNA